MAQAVGVRSGMAGEDLALRRVILNQFDTGPASGRLDKGHVRLHAFQADNRLDPISSKPGPPGFPQAQGVGIEMNGAFQIGDDDIDVIYMLNH